MDDFVGVLEWWDEKVGCLLTLALLVVIGCIGIVYSCTQENRTFKEFMAQCMKDHKEYECYALWRQGNRDQTAVVPIPIIIPTR